MKHPLVVSLVLAFACCGSLPRVLGQAPPSGPDDVELLFSAGLKAVASGELERGDYLTKLALRHQKNQPAAVPKIWRRFNAYLHSQKLRSSDRLGRLLFYREMVEAALEGCTNQKDFDQVWTVRTEVVEVTGLTRSKLVSEIEKEVLKFQRGLPKDPANALKTFLDLRTKLDPDISLVQASATIPGKKSELESLRRLAADLMNATDKTVQSLQKESDSIDKENKEKEISFAKGQGRIEELQKRLSSLATVLDQAQLEPLLPEGSTPRKLNETIGKLQTYLIKIQRTRYNVWALAQIYSAETSNNWDVQLGSIAVGLLHPATVSLYSAAYEKRVREVDDPQIRSQRVRLLLLTQKVALASF